MRTKPQYAAATAASVALAAVAATPAPAFAGPGVRTDKIKDVPDVTGVWYREIVEWADTTPGFVQVFMEHFTELGIVLLAAMWALVLWRTRRGPARPMAMALVGGAAVVLAYGLSEWSKTYLDAERPCRTFSDLHIIANECPPTGDWSFPSNHSTIAGALVAVILLVSWRLGLLALPIGALAAFSRVFVGVHYPHDVVAGFLLGVVVVPVVVWPLARPASRLVGSLRERPGLGRLLTSGDPDESRAVGRQPAGRG